MRPVVSVLMSVHNEPARFIEVAVKSICEQTYKNLEFIIIDDASEEETYDCLKDLADKHDIIKLYRNERNIGLTATLNKGLALCNGEFIARMDADDYSLPERIERQVDYLNEHSEIDILGTGVVSFGLDIKFMSPVDGFSYSDVQSSLFFQSSLCHPSVLIRKKFLIDNKLSYDENVKKGQDYDLWERASVCGNLAVMPEVLLFYRTHKKQITSTNRGEQDMTLKKVMKRRLNRIGINPSEEDMLCHLALLGHVNSATVSQIGAWIDKLTTHSSKYAFIDTPNFSKNLKDRFVVVKMKKHRMLDLSEWGIALRILRHRFLLKQRLDKIKSESISIFEWIK